MLIIFLHAYYFHKHWQISIYFLIDGYYWPTKIIKCFSCNSYHFEEVEKSQFIQAKVIGNIPRFLLIQESTRKSSQWLKVE